MDVNEDRLRSDIETNAEFGAVPTEEGHGRTLLTGTEPDRRAREFFAERLRDAGLSVSIDAVGNIVGRWEPPSVSTDLEAVVTGSHLDSVPNGGIFDGPLGVYASLEAVRTLQEAGVRPERPIAVVSFTEEEGQRFGGGLVGSSVAAGELTVDEALAIEDGDGVPLGDALADIGFRGDGRLDATRWDSWIEVHVEQGNSLDEADIPIGVVTSIAGLSRCTVEISGEANHAGTTPMPERTDALAAASQFILDVEAAATDRDGVAETAVSTVGKLGVEPNAPNVIAGDVSLAIDIRDVHETSISEIIEAARESLQAIETDRGVESTLSHPWNRPPIDMSERTRTVIHDAGCAAGIEPMDLHSGAGHDTMQIAGATDASLIFVPSRDGISHNPKEWTDWADSTKATQVLASALETLATS